MPTDITTVTAMLDRAASFPDHGLGFVRRDETESWQSWSAIRGRALEVAAGLRAHGVRAGDRVALVYPTGEEFFDAFFGVLYAAAVPVPLYPPVRLGRLAEYQRRTAAMLVAASVSLVLVDRMVQRVFGPVMERARPRLGCRRLEQLPGGGESAPETPAAGELALVQFSSGTTVDPKPVALSHRALVAQATILNSMWPEQRHSGVSWLPLYHDMGLIGCILPALERPGPLTLIPPELFVARPALWLRAISRHRATLSPAPNFAYGLCVDKIRDEEMDGVDLSCWEIALNGAEPVAPGVLRAFQERFARWGFDPAALTPVYGLSEAALAVSFSSLREPFCSRFFDRDRLGGDGRAVEHAEGREMVSVGRPLPGFELKVVDARGAELAAGHVGRLLVRGPSIMEGYLDRPDATARTLAGGWLDTGDLGFIVDGELFLSGRAKDLLILRGQNHSPEEVEQAVDRVAGVRTGCAVAVSWLPEGADGERLLVLVEADRAVPEDGYPEISAACRRAVLAATGLAAERVQVLPPGTLPRTSSGKLRRSEALRQFQADELHAPAPVTAIRLAGAVARSAVAYARVGWSRRGQHDG